jgi:hypothetical protein
MNLEMIKVYVVGKLQGQRHLERGNKRKVLKWTFE